jgi:ubiquinone/menaquinone biosynthesis C-methylase UbiE
MTRTGTSRRGESQVRVLLRNSIEAVYSRYAAPYDWLSGVLWAGQWRIWQRAALPFVQGPRVLEVGMGTGNMQVDLMELGFEVCGIDRAPAMLRVASKKVLERTGRRMAACRADVTALPFASSSFDCVVSTKPSDYIILPQTHEEIKRVLSPGGRFVIMVSGVLEPHARLRAIQRALLPRGGRQRGNSEIADSSMLIYSYEDDKGELNYWISEIKRRMEAVDFEVSMYIGPTEMSTAFLMVGEEKE